MQLVKNIPKGGLFEKKKMHGSLWLIKQLMKRFKTQNGKASLHLKLLTKYSTEADNTCKNFRLTPKAGKLFKDRNQLSTELSKLEFYHRIILYLLLNLLWIDCIDAVRGNNRPLS